MGRGNGKRRGNGKPGKSVRRAVEVPGIDRWSFRSWTAPQETIDEESDQ